MPIKQTLLLRMINGLAGFLPSISARLSYQLWTSTYRHKIPQKELPAYDDALKQKIIVDGAGIMTYCWGDFGTHRPLVLLLHGWNGRGTQLSLFVETLLSDGFNVVSFDARGHGLSDGNHTNVLQSVAIIKRLAVLHGDFFAMIGHSFGAMCAVNALDRGVVSQKIISISAPTEFAALLKVFSEHISLNEKASEALKNYVLSKYEIDSFERISITGIAPHMTIPLLLIHDRDDDKVPLSQGQKVVNLWGIDTVKDDPEETALETISANTNSSGTKLHITEGLGHVRILRNTEVQKISLQFLTN